MSRSHPKPIRSEPLGMEPGLLYFLKLPRSYNVVRVENTVLEKREILAVEVINQFSNDF